MICARCKKDVKWVGKNNFCWPCLLQSWTVNGKIICQKCGREIKNYVGDEGLCWKCQSAITRLVIERWNAEKKSKQQEAVK